ncbi:pts system, fructose-specific iia / iib / iic component [hydrocarbon metagenome]|uniref:Pts system, fructose-specific iia / iib / iic component n=1 Tax=hydrocarbon metagenome TaxID=938273 RepID=A0A0W8FQJ3_9ZZZZ
MPLEQFLKTEYVKSSLLAKTKVAALNELVDTVIHGGLKLDSSSIVEILVQRENLGSTGIGDGVAIPHGKTSAIDDLVVAFGRSMEGIDYDSADGKPVYLFFLLLAPENSAGQHLKVLARISKMLKKENFREMLLKAKSSNDLYKIIINQDNICIS